MTVIAAYETSKEYWIASDSMGGDSEEGILTTTGSKIIKKGNYYVGFADSYRVADIIDETPGFPKKINSIKDLRKFRDHLLSAMQSFGYDFSGVEHPILLIIISPYGIWSIEAEYQIHQNFNYFACGGGSCVALGALFSARALGIEDGERAVRNAVEASVMHSMICGGVCFVEFVKKIKK